MRKQKITVLIFMIALCLTGMWGMKKNTTVWGAVIRVNDVIVPKDIPAVAVEINKSSELITEKLSRVSIQFIQTQIHCIFQCSGMFRL